MDTKDIRIPVSDADRLLACADGLCALLYLHIVRTGEFSLPRAARELKCGEAELALAAGTLRRLGLLEKPERPLPDHTLPEFTGGDIAMRSDSDPSFASVLTETQKLLGRTLSSNDMKILLGIYEHLGLPADVIMLLLNHCIDEYREQNGPGRTPTMRYVEKEAWFWAEQEISSLDAAEEHIRLSAQKREAARRIKEALQIKGRELSMSEKKFIGSWLDMGYGAEAIAIAYDRTVMSTGKLAWKYMDRIIASWFEKKLFTPEEIEAGDRRPGRGAAPSGEESLEQKVERMKRLNRRLGGGD